MSPRAAAARARDVPSTRDVILDAAERRFAERGFAGVSMREIAGEAGLKNQASLYHHFRDKRALYEAVIARGITPIIALVAESGKSAASGDGPRLDVAGVDGVLDRILDYLDDHPSLPRLIQRAGLDDNRHLRSTIGKLLRPLWAQGIDALEAAGPWDASQLPHLALGLYHLLFGYFADAALFEAVTQQDPRSAAAIARQRRFLKAAFARLLGVAPAARAVAPSRRRS
ncbi:MAG TPA: helix-turn-helix domain-containing protein [Candidatus Binatia bacterium]|nr:helix-turn-helix domain-containing protein [Candidatus Binatia bacterium]